jgi:hypothetical protein
VLGGTSLAAVARWRKRVASPLAAAGGRASGRGPVSGAASFLPLTSKDRSAIPRRLSRGAGTWRVEPRLPEAFRKPRTLC